MHLRDLVEPGRVVTVTATLQDGSTQDISLFMRKPNVVQQEDALKKAKTSQARKRADYANHEGGDYMTLIESMRQMELSDIIDTLVSLSPKELREQARNEVLYGDEGSDWGDEGGVLFEAKAALEQIHDQYASGIIAGDEMGNIDDDPQVKELRGLIDRFVDEVAERREELERKEKVRLSGLSEEELKSMLLDRLIDTECNIAWYETYSDWMLYYSCKDVDKNEKNYFDNLSEMRELPGYIRDQLLQHYQDLATSNAGDIKN